MTYLSRQPVPDIEETPGYWFFFKEVEARIHPNHIQYQIDPQGHTKKMWKHVGDRDKRYIEVLWGSHPDVVRERIELILRFRFVEEGLKQDDSGEAIIAGGHTRYPVSQERTTLRDSPAMTSLPHFYQGIGNVVRMDPNPPQVNQRTAIPPLHVPSTSLELLCEVALANVVQAPTTSSPFHAAFSPFSYATDSGIGRDSVTGGSDNGRD